MISTQQGLEPTRDLYIVSNQSGQSKFLLRLAPFSHMPARALLGGGFINCLQARYHVTFGPSHRFAADHRQNTLTTTTTAPRMAVYHAFSDTRASGYDRKPQPKLTRICVAKT